MKVLHYKSNFLNYSETFIRRIIGHHQQFEPAAMCIEKRNFAEGIQVYEKPKQGMRGLINSAYFHLNGNLPFYNRTIQKAQPDVIHAHFGFDGWRMVKPALKNEVPFITSFYGSDVTRLPNEFDWKRRYRKLAQSCNAFIAISKHMKRQLIDLGFPEAKIFIIPFGLDLETFTFSAREVKGRSLMMVGRMVEKKGFEYALKAVKLLKEQNLNIHLDLYGDGPLENKLKQIAGELNITELVTFHGYVPNEKVNEELSNHQILLAPSVTAADGDEEGLPNTILEAMAAGVLVIASDHAAINEVVFQNETGLLAPERNAEAIAKSVKTALSNKDKAEEMKKNARMFIEENQDIKNTVKRIEELYKKVINGRLVS